MLALCLILAAAPTPRPTSILFLGNSHTSTNDVPGMVRSLLQADGMSVVAEARYGGFLEDIAADATVQRSMNSGKVDVLVMQAAKVSSSHKYVYSQAKGTALAKAAVSRGVKTFLYSEWPRKNIAETKFIEDVYRKIAKGSGATIVPVGRIWDKALLAKPKADLWSPDGNHASATGSYLAACSLAMWISDGKCSLAWRPKSVQPGDASIIAKAVRQSY